LGPPRLANFLIYAFKSHTTYLEVNLDDFCKPFQYFRFAIPRSETGKGKFRQYRPMFRIALWKLSASEFLRFDTKCHAFSIFQVPVESGVSTRVPRHVAFWKLTSVPTFKARTVSLCSHSLAGAVKRTHRIDTFNFCASLTQTARVSGSAFVLSRYLISILYIAGYVWGPESTYRRLRLSLLR
jgi:hypothetical protein